jgi:hypothetical protein
VQELPVSVGRAVKVFWSILWRAFVMLFTLGLCWKLIMHRRTEGIETTIWYVLVVLVYFVAVWWALRRNSWSEFRVVLLKKGAQ